MCLPSFLKLVTGRRRSISLKFINKKKYFYTLVHKIWKLKKCKSDRIWPTRGGRGHWVFLKKQPDLQQSRVFALEPSVRKYFLSISLTNIKNQNLALWQFFSASMPHNLQLHFWGREGVLRYHINKLHYFALQYK